MATNSSITVEFVGDLSKLRRDLDAATQEVGSLSERISARLDNVGRSLQKVGTGLSLGVTVPLLAIGKAAVDSAEQLSTVRAITAQVIEQTGGAANVTANQVNRLTKELERQTGVDDKLIQSGSNILLTFKEIRNEQGRNNDIFNRANEIMLDLATVTGTDATSAATQLGKALNDPVKGVTALQRVGVSFTDQQKDQIAAMVESGDTLGAQKLILKELESQYGGTAKASANATDKISQSWENIRERLGKALLPFINRLQKLVTRLARRFEGLSDQQVDMVVKVAAVVAAVGPLLVVLGSAIRTVGRLITVVSALSKALVFLAANPVVLVIAAVAALAAGLVIAYKRSEEFRDVVNTVFRFVARLIGAVVDNVLGLFQGLLDFWLSVLDKILGGAIAVLKVLKPEWAKSLETMRENVRTFRERANEELGKIRDRVDVSVRVTEFDKFKRDVNDLDGLLKRFKKRHQGPVKVPFEAVFRKFSGDGLGIGALADGSGSLLGVSPSSAVGRAYSALGRPGDVISGVRPGSRTLSGNLSYHAFGRALDFWPGTRALAFQIIRAFGARTKELITPWADIGILNGRRHRFSDPVQAQHDGRTGPIHFHWAMREGGFGTVTKPTVFLAGEAGTEDFAFAPHRKGGMSALADTAAVDRLIDRLDRQHHDTKMLLRQLIRAVQAGHVIDERSFAHALAPEMGRALAP